MEGRLHTECISCESKKLSGIVKYRPQMLMRCGDCGLVFDQRIPSELELSRHYSTYSYSQRKSVSVGTQLSFNELLDRFERFRSTNNILDVGCGQGDFLIAAKNRGWNIYGSEYSPAAVNLCEKAGIVMHQGEYRTGVFGDIVFDLVTSFEVLEHTNSPHDLVSASLSHLRCGGLFYLTTPNYNSVLRYLEGPKFKILGYPEHLALYTPASIVSLLGRYPLEREQLLTTGIDISRLKSSIASKARDTNSRSTFNPQDSRRANEAIRETLATGKGRVLKRAVNRILTLIGAGDTLKAFYVKQ